MDMPGIEIMGGVDDPKELTEANKVTESSFRNSIKNLDEGVWPLI